MGQILYKFDKLEESTKAIEAEKNNLARSTLALTGCAESLGSSRSEFCELLKGDLTATLCPECREIVTQLNLSCLTFSSTMISMKLKDLEVADSFQAGANSVPLQSSVPFQSTE
jgi:hypothetical protein